MVPRTPLIREVAECNLCQVSAHGACTEHRLRHMLSKNHRERRILRLLAGVRKRAHEQDKDRDDTEAKQTASEVLPMIAPNPEHRGHLSLTRRTGESVQIGEAVVTIRRTKPGSVELVIEAPRRVPIRRTELRPHT